MRDMVAGAFDGYDLRVGKKLRATAAHGLHEFALGTVDKQNRTFEPANERFDLSLGHRRGCAIAQNGVVLPAIAPASEMRPVPRHVHCRLIGNQWKRFLQRLGSGLERFVRKWDLDIVPAL